MRRRLVRGVVAVGLVAALPALAREPIRPAELPPPDYAGQQYVDSKGCLFMRAGEPGNVMWLPRVTRDGAPLCGNPPSGRRVPIAGEAEAAVTEAPEAAATDVQPPAVASTGGYYVAVGSFGVAENADRAEARLRAMNYPTSRGQMGDGGGLITIFAGPFADGESATRAQAELRGAGFPDAVALRN
jgi:hypothetical protein